MGSSLRCLMSYGIFALAFEVVETRFGMSGDIVITLKGLCGKEKTGYDW